MKTIVLILFVISSSCSTYQNRAPANYEEIFSKERAFFEHYFESKDALSRDYLTLSPKLFYRTEKAS